MNLLDRFRSSPATDADGLRGTAQVVTVSVHHGDTVNQTCEMHLVISAPGVAPLAVEFSGTVKRKVWPAPGALLPIVVDPANPVDYQILWDQVTPAKDAARAKAEGVAALRRGEPVDVGLLFGEVFLNGANVQVVGDISNLTENEKTELRMFTVDHTISRLERLAALRDSGAITETEFATQKAKILG